MVSTNMYINSNAAVAQRLQQLFETHIHIQGHKMIKLKEMWARLQERLAEERRARNTINELSKLTDYQLRDMGLNRGMIASVARGEYHG
jgi:uncharacterized protein YjiS (DUF1127 family)